MEAHAAKTGGTVDSKYLTGEKFEHEGLRKYPPLDFPYPAEKPLIDVPAPVVKARRRLCRGGLHLVRCGRMGRRR